MRLLSLLSEYLEEQRQGHLYGGQDYLASHILPQYFLDKLPLQLLFVMFHLKSMKA